MIRFASVCSGIGGAELAFAGIGHSVFASEIEAFPRAVLAHHFPHLTVHGDFTEISTDEPVDVLVGGTPCQSFSIAGLRGGMADKRGNLALEFLRLADRLRAQWVLWENVPGVLSSNDGRDFGSFVGGLAELGYGWAYRSLDAQFFGLAQRRKRVFVVGCLGDWRRAAAVLFEPACLRGDTPPSRQAREGTAGTLAARASAGGGLGTDFDLDGGLVAHSLRADGFDASEDGTGRGTQLVAFSGQMSTPSWQHDLSETIQSKNPRAVAFQSSQSGVREVDAHATLDSNNGSRRHNGILQHSVVRRLTPTECETLQGFPRGWTDVPYRGRQAADGPRYKALGNAFAVPVVRWIARRLTAEHARTDAQVAA